MRTDAGRRSAIVSGGSRGIGRAICQELGRRGCAVTFSWAGSAEAAQETLDLLAEAGVPAQAVQADVRSAEAARDLVAQAKEAFGGVDVLVNNAGITRDRLCVRMSEADFDAVVETNLKGAFLLTKEALRPMMRARSGAIVNISSVVGLLGNAGQANYAASKAGLIGLTRSVAREVAHLGITVNAVAPGFIETAMTDAMDERAREAMLTSVPARRPGTPADVARAVGFLASEDASYVTGQVLSVDGGMAM